MIIYNNNYKRKKKRNFTKINNEVLPFIKKFRNASAYQVKQGMENTVNIGKFDICIEPKQNFQTQITLSSQIRCVDK